MERQLYIGGRWVNGATDARLQVDDPATQEIIGSVPAGSATDVDRAVSAATGAFDQWRWMSADERAGLLHAAADKTRQHWDDLAELLTREQGKPRPEQEEELKWSAIPACGSSR
jgi:acyl-CoA reductase-like NAD-dependent aldehyde dehydrogenase